MDEKTMLELADKIKNGTATQEEMVIFKEEFAKLLAKMNDDLQ